ncbi:MAG TPA: hypothetical protein DCZ40_13300 [Lachnospiraceae bacterium]|nr:hypothetical protein [Lachnospiraceae bacterium]
MPEIMTMGELLCEIMRPEEGVELYETGDFKGPYPSGAPGIFVSTASRLGCSSGIIAGVGNDDFGKNIMDRLIRDGVDCRWILKSGKGSTGVAFVTYYADGSRKFIFHVENTSAVEPKAPESMEGMGDTKYFHIMGCSLMASAEFGREILKTMKLFRQKGAKISFDPNVRPELLRGSEGLDVVQEAFLTCNLLMPGVRELKMLTERSTVDEAVAAAFENENLEILVLKNGSKGSCVYTRKGLELEMGVYPVKQLDATGAGDSFDAAFICGLLQGKGLKGAAQMGAAAGALNAAAFGPMEGQISQETIEKMIHRHS